MAKQQLLLVERDAKTRRLLKVSLEQAGYAVVTARDGADALAKLELATPALVLTATALPKLNGYGLVRRMKDHSEWAKIPVIFMIASESIEDRIRGLELGVEEFLNRPVFVKELLSRVQVLLAKRVRERLSIPCATANVRGSLRDLPTIDLLESLEEGKQTGVVRIRRGAHAGEVFFKEGQIIDAELTHMRGEEVVFRLLGWTEGSFEVIATEVDRERIIEGTTRSVIEAGMSHASQCNKLLEQLPPTDEIVRVDADELAARLGRIPEELNGILTLCDGDRTLLDIIDDSPFDDLSTLQTLVKLHSEGLLLRAPSMLAEPALEVVSARPARMAIAPDPEPEPEPEAEPEPEPEPEPEAEPEPEPEPETTPKRGLPVDLVKTKVGHPPAPAQPPSAATEPAEGDLDDGELAPTTPRAGGRVSDPPGAKAPARASDVLPESMPPDTSEVDAAFSDDELEALRPAGVPVEAASEPATEPADSEPAANSEPSEPSGESEPSDAGEPSDEGAPSDESEASDEGEPSGASEASDESEPSDESEASDGGEPSDESEPSDGGEPSDESEPSDAAEPSDESKPAADSEAVAESKVPSTETPSTKPWGRKKEPEDKKGTKNKEGSSKSKPRPGDSEPPKSGSSELSTSGVSTGFFASSHEEEPPSEPPYSEEEKEVVYLTDEQLARKQRGKRIVAIVVGVLVALLAFAWLRTKLTGDGPPPSSTAKGATSTAPPSTGSSWLTSTASSAQTASAGAAAAGGATGGGEVAAAGAGGVAAPDPDDPIGSGGAVPAVDDPFKEAKRKLNVGNFKLTIPYARLAIKKDPENGDAYYFLALALQSTGRRDEAKQVFSACLERATRGQYLMQCKIGAPKKD